MSWFGEGFLPACGGRGHSLLLAERACLPVDSENSFLRISMDRTFSNGLARWSFRLERIRDHHWNDILANRAFTTLWLAHSRSRWPRTIRIRQDASVTTAEPAIAVTRDQVIDRIADHPWDEVKEPCPLPARKLARNAQHGFGFYIGLAARQEGKGIRVIRIMPSCSASGRPSANWIGTKRK